VLSIGFVLPYGEPSDGFFDDTLLSVLCEDARALGHQARLLRVYYHGRDPAQDRDISQRFVAWLGAHRVDLVVQERVLDPDALARHREVVPDCVGVMILRGDSFDPVPGVDLVVGARTGTVRRGDTRRAPSPEALALAFRRVLEALAQGKNPAQVPGVGRCHEGQVEALLALEPSPSRRPYRAVVTQEVLAPGPAPAVVRKTLHGNVGCPYGDDPLENPYHKNLALPPEEPIARLGCVFCHLGGDYEKRPDPEVVASLVEQARFWTEALPTLEELVLSDQHPLRYLGALLQAAREARVRPIRWLFAARADGFLKHQATLEQALGVARETGHHLELYLSGFEAFHDETLARYNKGLTVAVLREALGAMRALAQRWPEEFSYARARGHSLLLWNPWTTPEGLLEGLSVLREVGAGELFHEPGRNRLRLYRDLPVWYAARRDGALTDAWEAGDEGAARRKGYSVEQPWRFLDPRTRVAYELSRYLRDHLGQPTELAQLRAAGEYSRGLSDTDGQHPTPVMVCALESLERTLAGLSWAGPRGPVVRFAGACNNGCEGCAQRDGWLDDRPEAVHARVERARDEGPGPVVLAGREPTVHPVFLHAVAWARGADGRPVAVVTNGRRFAHGPFTRAAVARGLRGASVKVFAPEEALADALTRCPGAHAQTLEGLRSLRAEGLRDLELRVPLQGAVLPHLEGYVPLALALGLGALRVEVSLDALGLAHLGPAVEALGRLAQGCERAGLALRASPLRGGATVFEVYPRATRLAADTGTNSPQP
jgi:hypothetical protein